MANIFLYENDAGVLKILEWYKVLRCIMDTNEELNSTLKHADLVAKIELDTAESKHRKDTEK